MGWILARKEERASGAKKQPRSGLICVMASVGPVSRLAQVPGGPKVRFRRDGPGQVVKARSPVGWLRALLPELLSGSHQ